MNHFNQNIQKIKDEIQKRIDPSSEFATTTFAIASKSLAQSIGIDDAFQSFKSLHEHEMGDLLGGGNYGIAFSLLDLPGYALKIGFKGDSFHPAVEEFGRTRTTEKDFSSMQFKDAHASHANVLSLEEMNDETMKRWANSPGCAYAAVQYGKAFVQITELLEQNDQFLIRSLIISNLISVESRRVFFMNDIWKRTNGQRDKENLEKAKKNLEERIDRCVSIAIRYGKTDPNGILRNMAAPRLMSKKNSSVHQSIHDEIGRWNRNPPIDVDHEIRTIFKEWAFNPEQMKSEFNDVAQLFLHGNDVHPGNIGMRKNQQKIVGFDHLIAEGNSMKERTNIKILSETARPKKRSIISKFGKIFIEDLKKAQSNSGKFNLFISGHPNGVEFELKDEGTDVLLSCGQVLPTAKFECNGYRHHLPVNVSRSLQNQQYVLVNVFGDRRLLQNAPAGFQADGPKGKKYIVLFSSIAGNPNDLYHKAVSTFSHELEHLFHSFKDRKKYFSPSKSNPESIANFDFSSASLDDLRILRLIVSSSFLQTFKLFLSPTEVLAYVKHMFADATQRKAENRISFLESVIHHSLGVSDKLTKVLLDSNLIFDFDKVFSRCFATFEKTVVSAFWDATRPIAKQLLVFANGLINKYPNQKTMDVIAREISDFLFGFLFFAFFMNAKVVYGTKRIDRLVMSQLEKKSLSQIYSIASPEMKETIGSIIKKVLGTSVHSPALKGAIMENQNSIKIIIKENSSGNLLIQIPGEFDGFEIVELETENGDLETRVLQRDVSIPSSVFELGLRIFSVRKKKDGMPVAAIVKGPMFNSKGKPENMIASDGSILSEGIYDILLSQNVSRSAFHFIGRFIENHFFFRVDLRGRQIYHPKMAIQQSQLGQFIEGVKTSFIGKATSPDQWSGQRYRYSGTIRDPNEKIESPGLDDGERWG